MSGIIVIVLVLGVIALLRTKMGDASYEKMVLMLFGVLTLAFFVMVLVFKISESAS